MKHISDHTKDSLTQQASTSIDLVDEIRRIIEDDRESISDEKWPEYDELLEKILVRLEQLKSELEDV
ncbi:hypothetical protein [Metabacillus sp. Hm71]|uniref:hypothetical protein n=1 Tax=Metabacillus sp. Hm71 TaxID=3450743 RepID=UPI003F438525